MLTSDTLADALLKPVIRLGISTPKIDRGGDYTCEFFRK
jgi:hypothetical protein